MERERDGTGPEDQYMPCKNFQQVPASAECQLILASSGSLKRIGSRIKEEAVKRETVDTESKEMSG